MKRIVVCVLIALVCLSGCEEKNTTTPAYIEKNLSFPNGNDLLPYQGCYPLFSDQMFVPMNEAISRELQLWERLYEEAVQQAIDDVAMDPSMISVSRSFSIDYEISWYREELDDLLLEVTFCIKFVARATNAEPTLIRKLALYRNAMVFVTESTTYRVY